MDIINLYYNNRWIMNDMWIGEDIHLKEYNIFELNSPDYDLLVIANTYINPINIFLSNKDELPIKNGKIVFDLTLIYGCKTNRYVVAEIVDGALDIGSVKNIVSLDNSIEKISQNYFLNNYLLIENSHLSKADKYYVLHKYNKEY